MAAEEPRSLSTVIARRIAADGGWWPFDRYMAAALYEPGLGYYAAGGDQFGTLAAAPGANAHDDNGAGPRQRTAKAVRTNAGDFVTAPELSPLFGATLARQVAQVLAAAGSRDVTEFGAGTGALAEQLLRALPADVQYSIVDVSGALRQRQQTRLAPFAHRVRWLDALPASISGAVVGNEVLDAMPVQLLRWTGNAWCERGVAVAAGGADGAVAAVGAGGPAGAGARGGGNGRFVWEDRPTALRPPLNLDHAAAAGTVANADGHADAAAVVQPGFAPGTVTEIHPQAEAFVATLAERLHRGAAFFVDYGFPQAEYFHPQRTGGTLVCHRGHRVEAAEDAPLADPGSKDITAHVDFTGIAQAAQDAGADVLGYTSQARFLINCGLLDLLLQPGRGDLRSVGNAQTLLNEHEMGELFKVIGFARRLPADFAPIGFAAGDRTHTL